MHSAIVVALVVLAFRRWRTRRRRRPPTSTATARPISPQGFADAGALNVIYGNRGGLREDPDELWTQATRGIKGAVGNDRFGAAVVRPATEQTHDAGAYRRRVQRRLRDVGLRVPGRSRADR